MLASHERFREFGNIEMDCDRRLGKGDAARTRRGRSVPVGFPGLFLSSASTDHGSDRD